MRKQFFTPRTKKTALYLSAFMLSAALVTSPVSRASAHYSNALDSFKIQTPHMLQECSDKAPKTDMDKQGAGAENFIASMAARAIDFLEDPNLTESARKTAFKKLLKDSFDMKTISRFSLGRYWRVSTPQERDEYQDLFEKMVIEVYANRFSDYQGQKFETRSNRMDGPKDTIVTSFIVPDQGPEIQIDWRVRYKDGKYKVIDVIVEGVSMSVTQRSDFSSVIQRGGGNVQVLLAHLRDQ